MTRMGEAAVEGIGCWEEEFKRNRRTPADKFGVTVLSLFLLPTDLLLGTSLGLLDLLLFLVIGTVFNSVGFEFSSTSMMVWRGAQGGNTGGLSATCQRTT